MGNSGRETRESARLLETKAIVWDIPEEGRRVLKQRIRIPAKPFDVEVIHKPGKKEKQNSITSKGK